MERKVHVEWREKKDEYLRVAWIKTFFQIT